MSLFSHYQSLEKPFPCGADGFLIPNFKRAWVYAIGHHRFALDNEQNILTWQREWPTLDEDSKKAAMGNLIKMLGTKKIDDTARSLSSAEITFKAVELYLSVFTEKDALAWTTAFMSSDLPKRSAQDYEIPTLTFAAHLLDWTREHQPSALNTCVAMLESWEPLTQSKLYKDNEAFPDALERLSQVLPNTTLERISALACAISGQEALLSRLLCRPETNVDAFCTHVQSVGRNVPMFTVLSALEVEGKSEVFLANARRFATHLFAVYKEQIKVEAQQEIKPRLKGEELRHRCGFLHKLVVLDVECGDASVALLKTQASLMAIPRFFYFLGELSQAWSPRQHDDFMASWVHQGGFYVGEDMFGNNENQKAVLTALTKLPEEWTKWFEGAYRNELKKSGAGFMDPNSRNGISVDGHRWFHEHLPDVYKHWIRGLPANPVLLEDPVVGETAWEHTQAGSEQFLFDATLAWIKAPEVNYDLEHAHYPLAKLAWAHYGVDLGASLKVAMADTISDYRSLAVEAISPGKGKNRWHALMCMVDLFKENGDTRAHWSAHPLVQDVLRTCIDEGLHPTREPELLIDNGQSLFMSGF